MKTIVVHSFDMGDVDDIEVYAAEPLYKFEISEKGKWVMENALGPPTWYHNPSPNHFYAKIIIKATFTDELATYFNLKWT